MRSNLLGRVPGAEKLYIPCKEMDSGAGGGGGPGSGEPPCFYSLTHSDGGGSDPPRLDGLVSTAPSCGGRPVRREAAAGGYRWIHFKHLHSVVVIFL